VIDGKETACELMEHLAAELQERGDAHQAMLLLGLTYCLYGQEMDSGIDGDAEPERRGEIQAFNTGWIMGSLTEYKVGP
jgi:hypothetical protein